MKERAFNLLKNWCDKLIEHQITQISDLHIHGGIICPACAFIHGRCADMVFPLVYLYSETGDEKYIESAKLLVDWAENNVKRTDGSYYNDVNKDWKCTTSFFQVGMGETLIHFADKLDEDTYKKWYSIFKRQSEFMIGYLGVSPVRPHINYYCAWAHSMAMAYKVLEEERYREKAKYWLDFDLKFITDDYLFCGEGHPIDVKTKRGRRAVDLGYNVEESLPALASCAMILGDSDALKKIERCILAHIEFMLPDGGWDNSFGTRNGKWTYYGSRTSDGCQTAFLNFDNDIIREAALRNFEQYEKCTFEGELYGGPMYYNAGEPACYHHAMCHAKSLAHICIADIKRKNVSLPRDAEYGIKRFDSAGAVLVSKGKWRATITDNDYYSYPLSNPLGTSITMLYHTKIGVIFAASMTKYQIIEPGNFQLQRGRDYEPCSTVRIENGEYTNLLDVGATVDENLTAKGRLYNKKGEADGNFEIKYEFLEESFVMKVKADTDAKLIVPIANYDKINFEANTGILFGERFLSLPNGFMFTPIEIDLKRNETYVVSISEK